MTMTWWWLSFADEDQFLGGVFVMGEDMVDATVNAHVLGINPGGQVAGMAIPEAPPDEWRGRLLDAEQVEEFDRAMGA